MRRLIITLILAINFVACEEEQVDATPSTPNLIFPVNFTECANDELVFQWSQSSSPVGNQIAYNLYLSTSPEIDENVQIFSTNNTEFLLTLPQGLFIYWVVEATDGNISSYSEVYSLFTQLDNGIVNSAPNIFYESPENNATIQGPNFQLTWIGEDEETIVFDLDYKLYFSEVGQNLELINEGIGVTSQPLTNLSSGSSYQWSVWVTDQDGATNVGQLQKFTVN